MGFESFHVELRGGPATAERMAATLRQRPGAKPDRGTTPPDGSSYFTVEDGSHVIEVEVAASPPRVSCRFTLCHPPSVDAAFLALVRDLMTQLGTDARVCDDVAPGHARPFPLARFPEFAEVVKDRVAARRAEWVAAFGPAHLAATTPEAHEKVILPRCVPAAG